VVARHAAAARRRRRGRVQVPRVRVCGGLRVARGKGARGRAAEQGAVGEGGLRAAWAVRCGVGAVWRV